jgi:ABC-2 type transport system permease protein
MTAFLQHLSFEFRTGIRNRTLLMMNYLFPLGFYVLMGLLMTKINPPFRETMIPAMVTFAILASTFLGLPDPLVTARNAGIFRTYRINGVPAMSIVLIPALTVLLHLTVVAIIMAVTAPLMFQGPLPVHWVNFVLIFLLTAFACAGLGVLIGVISSSSQMTVLWAQLIFLPSMMLGGMMMPYKVLPGALSKIALLLPSTHAMNAFRGLAYKLSPDFDPFLSLGVLLAVGLLAFGLAISLFTWDSSYAGSRRRNLLALLVLLPGIAGVLLV